MVLEIFTLISFGFAWCERALNVNIKLDFHEPIWKRCRIRVCTNINLTLKGYLH